MQVSGLYDLANPNKCQSLFLDHDDETDENEAVEVDEVDRWAKMKSRRRWTRAGSLRL